MLSELFLVALNFVIVVLLDVRVYFMDRYWHVEQTFAELGQQVSPKCWYLSTKVHAVASQAIIVSEFAMY